MAQEKFKRMSFRPEEVAKILGVSRSAVFRWCRDGVIRYTRPSTGVMLIPQSELDRVLELPALPESPEPAESTAASGPPEAPGRIFDRPGPGRTRKDQPPAAS